MAMFYINDTKLPQGWVANTTTTILEAQAEGWERQDATSQHVDAGFHRYIVTPSPPLFLLAKLITPSATLDISYMDDASLTGVVLQDAEVPLRQIPEKLAYVANPILSDMHRHAGSVAELHPARDRGDPADQSPSTTVETGDKEASSNDQLAQASNTAISLWATSNTRSRLARFRSFGTVNGVSGGMQEPLNTQSSNVGDMKKAFSSMMQQEYVTQGDTQSQLPLSMASCVDGGKKTKRPTRQNSLHSTQSPLRSQHGDTLDHQTIPCQREASGADPSQANDIATRVIHCQCGSSMEDELMVR